MFKHPSLSRGTNSLFSNPQSFARKIVSTLLVWAMVMTSLPAYSVAGGPAPRWVAGWDAGLVPLSGALKKSTAASVLPPEIEPVKPRATSVSPVAKQPAAASVQASHMRPVALSGTGAFSVGPTSNLALLLNSPLKGVLGTNFLFQSGGPTSLAVYVGYADNLRPDPNFPVPWQGSPNTTFIGVGPSFDSGAIRLDNNSNSPIQVDDVFVTVPGWTATSNFDSHGNGIADLWGSFSIPANSTVILAQTSNGNNFDTSDFGVTGCGNTIPDGQSPFPTVRITIGGVPTTFNDSGHVLDTGGFDLACRGNESLQWRLIGTSGIQNSTGHVTLAPPTSVQAAGTPYTAVAQVTDAGGAPTPNVVVNFSVLSGPDAGKTGTGTTDSQGNATFTYTSTVAGTDILQATVTNAFGGSIQSNQVTSTWTSADPCPAPVTPPGPSTTSLGLVGQATGEFNDPLTLAAQLTDGNGNPLSGRSLSFAFNSQTFQATTDGNGIGTVNLAAAPAPGSVPLTVNYAGETNFKPAQLNASINIDREETAIRYTGGVLLGTAVPQPVSAILTDPESGQPIANETVTFRVGTVQAQAVTNAQGVASTTLTLGPAQTSGPNAMVVSFAGDSFYKPSLTGTQITVYLSTSFVIWGGNAGGLHLGQDVNFWGSQWENQVISGNFNTKGNGLQSFKGFSDPVNQIHVCEVSAGSGGRLDDSCWSSKGGQTFPPPISVPAFIEVIVSTAINKTGSEIFGNIAAAAVCQVDPTPAYGPDPGKPGFCKLVAVVEDGGNIFPTPPALTATQTQPLTVLPAQNFNVTTTVTNSSTSVANSVVVNESFDGVTPATGTQTISSILNGAQKTTTFQETTPAIPLRQSNESSVDYQARLASVDGRLFTSTGSVTFTDAFGQPFLPIPVSSSSRLQIPELTLGISGPSCVGPGSKIPYKVTVGNIGAADAKNVTILMVFPDGSTGTATIATIPAGGSVSTTFNFVVPAITAKQPNESDQQYLARLALIDGSQLTAEAKVNWQDAIGNNYGQVDQQFISTTERVPIISVTPTGPAKLLPGQKATLNYAVQNIGGGNASQVALQITNPDGSITNIAPFALQGGQATAVSSTFTVPVVPAKGPTETDAAYQARLTALDNSALNFVGKVTWLDAAANSYGPTSPSFQSMEILPVMTVDLAGPANLSSGENSNYHLRITNLGHADAASFTAPVKLPDGSTVNPFPPSGLVIGATAQIFVPFSIPKTQPDGQVSATATLNWSDANTNAYGPQSATVTSANVRPNQPPVVNAGPNQTITLPTNSVILNGTVTDDGKPVGAVLTIQWTQVSGPQPVTFSQPNLPVTQVLFVTSGVYVLQLSANDTQFTTTSRVTVTVNANGNQPPVVNAGPDQTINLFGAATFNGSVTDDGLPAGAPLTSAWTFVSGPGAVIFSSPSSPQTFATSSAIGQYVLQLSGNDTQFTTTSNVNLTVNPPVIPNNNLPPVVNAGPNQTITLPTNSVTLNGTVTDDGLPVGGTLSQFWTAMSGPGAVTFANSQAAVTTATFTTAGTYVLRLTASDSQLTSSSDTTVTVNTGTGRLVGNIEVCYFCSKDLGFGKFQDGPTFIFHNTDTQDITNGVFKIGPGGGFTDSYNVGTIPAGGTVLVAPGLTNDGGTGHTFFAFRGSIRDTSDEGPDGNDVQFEFTGAQGSATVDTGVFTPASSIGPSLDNTVAQLNFLGGPNGADGPCNNCFDNIIANLIAGTVANTALLKITKTHSGNFTTGQQNATYTITASNASTTTATSGTVTVSDSVPPGMTLVSASGTGWTCTAGVCSRTDVLAAGASYPAITVTVNVAANATSPQVNIANVTGGGSASGITSDATAITGAAKFPVVNAGGAQTINLPTNTVTLNGSGSSDTGTLTFTWTKLTGPGTVTFSNANAAVTQATFSAVGTYLLQLSGSDGANTAISNTTVTLNPPVNQPPVVSAGANQTITLPTNSVTLNGTATDDGLPTGSTLTVSWNQVSGPAAVVFATPTKTTTQVTFTAAGIYDLRLTASDSQLFSSSDVQITVNPAPQALTVSAGPGQTITFPVNKVTMNGSASGGNGPLTLTWSAVSGSGSVTFSSPNSAVTQATFSAPGSYVLQLSATDGTTTATSTAGVAVNPGPAPPLTVSAGPSQTITLPVNTVILNGSASGGSGPLTLTWSKVSGPGTVTFSSPNSAVTQATFSTFGSYVLKLTATDGTVTVSATTGVGVNPVPVAVSAGASQTITLPTNTVTLNGSASGGSAPLTISWSEVSGPAAVTFGSPSSAVTTATFSAAGLYVLQLSATDGFSSASATTSVAVNPPPAQPPVVSAGPNQTITLPTNTATLNGSATSSNGPITFAWSEVSGPAAVTFSSPNSAVTQATFSVAGTYVLQLSANDTKFTVTATTSVIVNPAPPPPPPPTVTVNLPEGTEITSPTQIIGSVSGGSWKLQYALGSADGVGPAPVFTTFASGNTPVSNGLLGTIDPTTLLNGNYIIQLVSTDQFGQTSTISSNVDVARTTKIGNFSLTFKDLEVPVSGLPITVTRSYDSRDKSSHDFGFGWTLSISNVRLQKNGVLGAVWEMTQSGGFLPNFCIQPDKQHIVTITFPDNRVYKFQAGTSPQCQQIVPIEFANLAFTQMPGPANTQGATLQVAGDSSVFVNPSSPGPLDLVNFDTLEDANPTVFQLTTAEGFSYIIDQNLGVTSLTDPNGNTLTINANGVTSSTGKSVAFVRDGQNRITKITDPAGNALAYSYSAAGDLASFTDRAGNTSTFTYDHTHLLTNITDPRGLQPIKTTYDASGRVASMTDANGNTTTFTHALASNQEAVQDALGNTTVFTYDQDGNVTQTVDALGNTSSFTYDANDNQLTATDPLGHTTTFAYDAVGNQTSVTDALGHTTTSSFNARRQPLTVTDPLGHVLTGSYDGNGNLLSRADPLGNSNVYTYNAQGLLQTQTDPLGNKAISAYDANGNLTQLTDPLGNAVSSTYDANNNELSRTVTRTKADGTKETLTTQYQYDGNGRPIKTINPDGTTTQVIYNAIGQQSDTVDALGRKTHYDYDAAGRPVKQTYSDGTTESVAYDANGNRLTTTDRAGHTTFFTYDALNRLTKTTYPDGTTTQSVYDAAGRVIKTIDTLGNVTQKAYDAVGRCTSITDALGHVTSFTYDAAGNQLSITDALNHTTQFVYDADSRRIQTSFPDNTTFSVGYDKQGRVTSRTDQAGKTTQYAFDPDGRLASATDALGQVTKYGYDEIGNRITQTDANGHTTSFAYDQLGRRISRTLPLGMNESYTYNAAGNLTARKDFNGHTTTYSYDAVNRLTQKTADAFFSIGPCAGGACGATQVSYTYTTTGLRSSMTDASGTTNYTYDARNHLLSKATPFGTLTYTYDAVGNVLSLKSSNANGASMAYTYDALNRLVSVQDSSGTTTYSYDAVGNLSGYAYPNGVQTSYQYNTLNRLTGMQSTCGTAGPGCGAPGTAVSSYAYTLGPAGNRLSVAELSGRTVQYGYDGLYRVTSEAITGASSQNGSVNYTFDPVGNRTQISSTIPAIPSGLLNYDANDRLAADVYDANGNTVNTGGIANIYDFENHLVQRGGVSVSYDGDGNRISETVAGVTTNDLVADINLTGFAQVMDELQGGTVSRAYSYGLTMISERQPVSGTPTTSFYGYDGHGSVRFLTSSTGAVTDTYDYDAFGNLLSSTGSTPNNYLFAGEQFDPALGIYYNRARYYDQRRGRFWSMDTFEGSNHDPLSLHKYLYTEANPVNHTDPTGNQIDDLMVSFAIQATLSSIATLVINSPLGNSIASFVASLFIPKDCIDCVLHRSPNAVEVGAYAQATLNLRNPIIGATGFGGIDFLVSLNTGNRALYFFLGAGITFGSTTSGGAAGGTLGLVWNTPSSDAYEGDFENLTIPAFALGTQTVYRLQAQLSTIPFALLVDGLPVAFGDLTRLLLSVSVVRQISQDSAVTVFWTPNWAPGTPAGGPHSCGVNFGVSKSRGIGNLAPSTNWAFSVSYYWQFYPDQAVPF